ncbi:MAG: hypothetical protein AB1813_26035, partial [Verrucomicrobiota bacterium]
MPPHSKRGAGQPDAFGVRRQNEVTTALWPRLDARRTVNARRIGQSGVALALCHRTPKGVPANPTLLECAGRTKWRRRF